jgi:hypothetical protein
MACDKRDYRRMGPRSEQLIRDYLNQLSVAAHGCLQAADRRALIADIRARIDGHVQSAADTSPRAVREFLEGLGDPAAIVDSESERLAQQVATSSRLRVPDWQKGLRSTVQLRHRRIARAVDQPGPVAVDGPVLSGPADTDSAGTGPAVNRAAANGAAPDHLDSASAGECTETAAPEVAADEPAAVPGSRGDDPPGSPRSEEEPAGEAISVSHVRGDVGISLVSSRVSAEPGPNGAAPGSEAGLAGAGPAGTTATSDPATEAAAAAADVSATSANEDAGVGLLTGKAAAKGAADPLIVERPFGAPRRPPGQRRSIVRKAPPTGAAKAAETAAAAVQPPPAPSPPVAAWRATASTAGDHPLEVVAIAVLAVGTLIYPPIWLLGVLLSLPARAWDYRDKWTGLGGPVLLLAIAVGLYVALGRGSASVSMFFHHAWVFASYFSRVLALLGAGFLGWRLFRGHPPSTVPPWNRRTDPG